MLKQLRISLFALTVAFAFAPAIRAEGPDVQLLSQLFSNLAALVIGAAGGVSTAMLDAFTAGTRAERPAWAITYLGEGHLRPIILHSVMKLARATEITEVTCQITSRILSYVMYVITYNKRVLDRRPQIGVIAWTAKFFTSAVVFLSIGGFLTHNVGHYHTSTL